MGTTQFVNQEREDNLDYAYVRRDEPNFAWRAGPAVLANLSGVRGGWTMASFDENGDVFDVSGQGRTLTYNGNPTFNLDGLAPYLDLDGVGDYLSRADEAGLDILGTETYVAAARRGLTFGGWVYFNGAAVAVTYFMAKHGGAGQRAYYIRRNAAGNLQVFVSVDGTAETFKSFSTVSAAATWLCVIGRFTPSTELALFVNNVKETNLVGIPASIHNSTAPFQIGSRNAAANAMTGRISHDFLCASALSDAAIGTFYHQTRSMYGV